MIVQSVARIYPDQDLYRHFLRYDCGALETTPSRVFESEIDVTYRISICGGYQGSRFDARSSNPPITSAELFAIHIVMRKYSVLGEFCAIYKIQQSNQ